MNKFLKGNYCVQNDNEKGDEEQSEDFSEIFENRAFEKLGGSIAFVMKSSQFVWEDDDDNE